MCKMIDLRKTGPTPRKFFTRPLYLFRKICAGRI